MQFRHGSLGDGSRNHVRPVSNVSEHSREAVLERLRLFREGVEPPYRRAGEIAIGAELRGLAESKALRFGAVAKMSGVSMEKVHQFMEGLFKMESADMPALERIANLLGSEFERLISLANAPRVFANAPRNDFGCTALFKELKRQVKTNPDMHEDSIDIGVGVRFLRNISGIDRRELSEKSGVGLYVLVFLEHLLWPNEMLNGEIVEIGKALGPGITLEDLKGRGRGIRRDLCMGDKEVDVDRLVDAVKNLIEASRVRRMV